MSTFSAKFNTRLIVIVVYDGVTLLDVCGPAQVFTTANNEMVASQTKYQIELVSLNGGQVTTDSGIRLDTNSISLKLDQTIDTLIVAGGNGVFEAAQKTQLIAWLKSRIPSTDCVVSTCMGAFLIAETGLLNNLQVTTHWKWCDVLQSRYPEIDVLSDPIFIRQGKYTSTAGVVSGIDLALTLVEEDHGRSVALNVAKSLVLHLRRTGTQSQFSSLLRFQSKGHSKRFSQLNLWILDNLAQEISVERLAKKAGMSDRSFARLYTKHTGLTPAKAVEKFRFETAKLLLETTSASLKSISYESGFKGYERMRRAFVRHIDITPTEYRRRFGL